MSSSANPLPSLAFLAPTPTRQVLFAAAVWLTETHPYARRVHHHLEMSGLVASFVVLSCGSVLQSSFTNRTVKEVFSSLLVIALLGSLVVIVVAIVYDITTVVKMAEKRISRRFSGKIDPRDLDDLGGFDGIATGVLASDGDGGGGMPMQTLGSGGDELVMDNPIFGDDES